MSSVPATPLPSSTVILLREEPTGDGPFAVLMVKRHASVTYPGVHAFPGGVLDPHDAHAPGASLPATQAWPAPGEGDRPPDALRYWITALRELFEETGILLAHRAGRPLEGPLPPAVAALRARLDAETSFTALLAEHDLVPATDALFYFARWITPRVNPRRFDTRFLVGRTHAGQDIAVDGTETESAEWLAPQAAIARFVEGEIDLIPPTVRTLDDLARFDSIDEVLRHASRRVVRPASPEIDTMGGERSMTYRDETGESAPRPRRLVQRGGRWRPAE
jgi:8-oxo-dGTP pyrophosphatase MutT (NUDIX family)